MPLHGWLFDVYPSAHGMILWVIDADGRPHRLRYPYAPSMYVGGDRGARGFAESTVGSLGIRTRLSPAIQKELMTGDEIDVLRVAVENPLAYPVVARRLAHVPGLSLYNCDVPLGRLFFYENRLFPLARLGVHCAGDIALEIGLESQSNDLEYDAPPLTILRLRLGHEPGREGANPTHGRRGRIEADVDGEAVVIVGEDPRESIRSLNRLLTRYDPDVILTEWGDELLLPTLRAMAREAGMPLALNRDSAAGVRLRRSRSYTTYGKVVFQGGAQMLHGRWHLDLCNSFIYGEAELAGLLDIARLSRIPVQELARTSTGTAISSMQLNQAIQDHVLIPWQKNEPEGFKTASQLLLSDKGGLTYQPIVGMFEEVGELDFSSMYPTMMSQFNISPETIGCSCCPDSRVPEIGYTVCTKRRGLVPHVLEHLLERRNYYKKRKLETAGEERAMYDQRQTALKWCLVTSFGYLGYRNARFGRIEAHEATTAYAREKLLQAKEIAEVRGFRMLHALVDSMWLNRTGATRHDYDVLAAEVSAKTELPIFVEGVYRWIGFLPSKTHRGVGVPNRYLGVFQDDSTKVRGIEVRRSDIPILVEKMQERMLQRMFRCATLAELRAALPEVLAILEETLVRLRSGEVTAPELIVTNRLSQEVENYRHNTVQAITARTLDRNGASLHPGEAVQFIITNRKAKVPEDRVRPYTLLGNDWSYDAHAYAQMLVRATETILELLGYTEERLWAEVWEPVNPA